jgi:hypothetical protein
VVKRAMALGVCVLALSSMPRSLNAQSSLFALRDSILTSTQRLNALSIELVNLGKRQPDYLTITNAISGYAGNPPSSYLVSVVDLITRIAPTDTTAARSASGVFQFGMESMDRSAGNIQSVLNSLDVSRTFVPRPTLANAESIIEQINRLAELFERAGALIRTRSRL